MPWQYQQRDGELTLDSQFEGTGYSGTGQGRNNPEMEAVENVGPIPRGKYKMGPSHQHPKLGPMVFDLEPLEGTETFGRDAFRIHGDSKNHDASHGCIVLGPSIRGLIASTLDRSLEVL